MPNPPVTPPQQGPPGAGGDPSQQQPPPPQDFGSADDPNVTFQDMLFKKMTHLSPAEQEVIKQELEKRGFDTSIFATLNQGPQMGMLPQGGLQGPGPGPGPGNPQITPQPQGQPPQTPQGA